MTEKEKTITHNKNIIKFYKPISGTKGKRTCPYERCDYLCMPPKHIDGKQNKISKCCLLNDYFLSLRLASPSSDEISLVWPDLHLIVITDFISMCTQIISLIVFVRIFPQN